MDVPTSREKLEAFFGKIGESQQLEFKAGQKLNSANEAKAEITKIISGMANATGGVVIFGISEYREKDLRHLPEKFSPVNCSDYSREWLDQIIGQIQPKIPDVKIHDVHVGPTSTDYCYVVEIPQARTAHQATDLRYYRRRNFELTAMLDYEIRDLMNRRTSPEVNVEIKMADPSFGVSGKLLVKFSNSGKMIARDYLAVFEFPTHLNGRAVKFRHAESMPERYDGQYRWMFGVGKKLASGPLFPSMACIFTEEFEYDPTASAGIFPSIPEIRLTVYADDMPAKKLTKDLALAWSNWV